MWIYLSHKMQCGLITLAQIISIFLYPNNQSKSKSKTRSKHIFRTVSVLFKKKKNLFYSQMMIYICLSIYLLVFHMDGIASYQLLLNGW